MQHLSTDLERATWKNFDFSKITAFGLAINDLKNGDNEALGTLVTLVVYRNLNEHENHESDWYKHSDVKKNHTNRIQIPQYTDFGSVQHMFE